MGEIVSLCPQCKQPSAQDAEGNLWRNGFCISHGYYYPPLWSSEPNGKGFIMKLCQRPNCMNYTNQPLYCRPCAESHNKQPPFGSD